jgi:SAM-dependent methyltransferase
VANGLRQREQPFALIARGGYAWSRFAAWQSAPDDATTIAIAKREARLCHSADLVVGTTQDMLDDLAWRHHLPNHRLALVPNYSTLSSTPSVARAENIILSVGRLVPQKRFDLLIEAVSQLPAERRASLSLSIIGQGPMESDLRSLAAARGVQLSIESLRPHHDVLARMQRCTVYVQSSAFEGHPKTVVEAMSSGAPVLLADAPGLRGLITHGISGATAPASPECICAALKHLLDHPELRASMGAAAATQARTEFALDRIAELEAGLYPRVLALAGARAEQAVDISQAVRWSPDLLSTTPSRAADAWERSITAFSQRLAPSNRARFLTTLDSAIYNLEGPAAIAAEPSGLHPKHRVMRYHDFFTDRIRPGERVIDLGCGVGALAASIADVSRASVLGMDRSEASLQRARRIAQERGLHGRLSYKLGDITADRAPGQFDVAVLSNVLEHIQDRPERIRLWREWYQPDRFLIRVPAFDRDWRVPWKKDLGVEWRLDLTHETEYTQSQLEEELRQAGLRAAEWVVRWGEYWVVAKPA